MAKKFFDSLGEKIKDKKGKKDNAELNLLKELSNSKSSEDIVDALFNNKNNTKNKDEN